jgi:hypothetical protein
MKLLGNLVEISSTKIGQYPGDTSGDSIIATLKGSAEKGETAQVQGQTGIIGNPPKGAKGLRIRIGSLDIIISSLNYKVALPANPGETKVYSTDPDGVEKAGTIYRNDGSQEINGENDFAIRFSEMKAAFNELKQDLNDAISTYNSHTHPTPSGPSSPPAQLQISSTADMSDAKVDTVKLPGLGEVYP